MDRLLEPNLTHTQSAEALLADGFAQRLSALAKHLKATPAAIQLVRGAAAEISQATSQGHVCVPLADLSEQFDYALPMMRTLLLSSGVACDGRAEAAELLPFVLDTENRLYLAHYYEYERRLAHALVARTCSIQNGAAYPLSHAPAGATENTEPLYERLAHYFKAPVDGEIDIQQVAAALALLNPITIISGGPGTGKTTTVVGILACLLDADPNLRIALAAPTGRAAQRLTQALALNAHHLPAALAARLPKQSSTLHRLLGSRLSRRSRPGYHPLAPLPYDVVIVDEASMIDIGLAVHLVEALAPTTRLILLGDKNQLSAVEAGAVFAELSARPIWTAPYQHQLACALKVDAAQLAAALPTVPTLQYSTANEHLEQKSTFEPLANCVIWLERNYRFGANSAIARLAHAINAGLPTEALASLTYSASDASAQAIFIEDVEAGIPASSLAQLAAGFTPYAQALAQTLQHATETGAEVDCELLFATLNRYRVLAAVRDGRRGVESLNELLSMHLRQAIKRANAKALPASNFTDEWFPGRPVIIMRNDYALELFNGDIGIALPDAQGALRIAFPALQGPRPELGEKPESSWRWLSPAVLPPHETALAMTVHKSQGSEFDCVALVLPATANRTLTRTLLYTAVTRARSKVIITGSPAILTQAVASSAQRHSGLAARLQEVAANLEE